jgi:predicted nucleic acid-binding protein
VAIDSRVYVDPSALRALYVHDDRSRSFCAWRGRTRRPLPVTMFGRAELVNSIALAVFRNDIDEGTGRDAMADLEQDFEDGRLALTDLLWRLALERAADLSRVHTPTLGTRSLDVLHVASAQVLGCRGFVSYDERQLALAKAVGLKLVRPQ